MLDRLSHILVLYMENRSFDNLFGEFPGANGIAQAGEAAVQRDREGKPYAVLPVAKGPFHVRGEPGGAEQHRDTRGSAEPALLDRRHAPGRHRGDAHPGPHPRFLHEPLADPRRQERLLRAVLERRRARHGLLRRRGHEGHESLEARRSATRSSTTSSWARFGGSFLNHIWLVCACAPVWPDPPKSQRSQVDAEGHVVEERRVTAPGDGDYAVNTTQSIFLNNGRQAENVLPPQRAATIGDRLTEKGVGWAWYSGGWDLATQVDRTPEEEGAAAQSFQWHHQPFAYFARFDPTTQSGRDQRTAHLATRATLEADIKSGKLPPVAFYKPIGVLNQHPGYASLIPGDEEIGRIIKLMDESPMKDSYAVIITYDENGGFWDHVAPPHGPAAGARADFFGPGTRIPTVVVSPFAQGGGRPYRVRDDLDPAADQRAPPAQPTPERALRGGRESAKAFQGAK